MKSLLASTALMLASAVSLHADDAPQYPQPNKAVPVQAEEWQYTMKIKLPGTRSEARIGVLTKDGAEISGKTVGDVLETPYGKLEWRGTEGFLKGWQPHVEPGKAKAKEEQ